MVLALIVVMLISLMTLATKLQWANEEEKVPTKKIETGMVEQPKLSLMTDVLALVRFATRREEREHSV